MVSRAMRMPECQVLVTTARDRALPHSLGRHSTDHQLHRKVSASLRRERESAPILDRPALVCRVKGGMLKSASPAKKQSRRFCDCRRVCADRNRCETHLLRCAAGGVDRRLGGGRTESLRPAGTLCSGADRRSHGSRSVAEATTVKRAFGGPFLAVAVGLPSVPCTN